MPTGIWQLVPVGQVSPFLQRSPQWSGGGLPVEENSHVGMAVAPVAAGKWYYEATILTSARRSKSGQYASYSVAFKGDAPPGVEVPARQVQFTQVVALTAAADVV